MNKKALLVLGLLLAATVLIPLAYAEMYGNGGMGPGSSAALSGLNLGDYQASKVASYQRVYRAETYGLRDDIAKQQSKLQTLINEPDQNAVLINATVNKIAILNARLTKRDLELARDIRTVLTPDQLAKYNAKGALMVYGLGPEEVLGQGYLCQFVPGAASPDGKPAPDKGTIDPDWDGYR